jgi:hypothetical protein
MQVLTGASHFGLDNPTFITADNVYQNPQPIGKLTPTSSYMATLTLCLPRLQISTAGFALLPMPPTLEI